MTETIPLLLTVLYRFYDADGRLLYVGITDDLRGRLYHHARHKEWWPKVDQTRTRVEWIGNRTAAERAELLAIYAEDPAHNRIRGDAEGRPVWPSWSPVNDEQRRLLATAERLAEVAKRAEAEMWAAILAARQADVPDTVLCQRTGQSRATLNRRYGPREA